MVTLISKTRPVSQPLSTTSVRPQANLASPSAEPRGSKGNTVQTSLLRAVLRSLSAFAV